MTTTWKNIDPARPSKVVGNTLEMEGMRLDGELFPLELSVEKVQLGEDIIFIGIVTGYFRSQESGTRVETAGSGHGNRRRNRFFRKGLANVPSI